MLAFLGKLIGGMAIMSLVVQSVMFIITTDSRMMGLIELLVSTCAGVVVLIIYVDIFNVLSYKELKHLPFGDKLYQFKRGRRL